MNMFQFTQDTMWIYAMFSMGIILCITKYVDQVININKKRKLFEKFFKQGQQ